MSETYKAGDRVEFVENYFEAKIGTRATVKLVDDDLLHFEEDITGAYSIRVKKVQEEARIKVGDKVRANAGVGSLKWIGAEGDVVEVLPDIDRVRLRLTKIHPDSIYTTGEIAILATDSLDVVEPEPKPKIEVGDLVRINNKTYSDKLVGVEGIVTKVGYFVEFNTTDGKNSILNKGDVGSMHIEKLDVVKKASELAEEAKPKVGDAVRITSGAWEGSEGVVEYIDATTTGIRMTKPSKRCWISEGAVGRLSAATTYEKIAETAEPEARVVKLSEVRVGDLVRVTYAPSEGESCGVKNTMQRVREGVVGRVNGSELSTDKRHLINAYFEGLSEAVYEVLPTPEPVKELSWAEKRGVGSVGLQKGGRRFLTKQDENSWEIKYPSAIASVEKTNEGVAFMFSEDDFLWTERK